MKATQQKSVTMRWH